MDRSAKSFFAVSLSVVALLLITGLVINADSPESPSLLTTVIVIAVAVVFWVWVWLDARPRRLIQDHGAEGDALQLPQRQDQVQEWVIDRPMDRQPSTPALASGVAAQSAQAEPLPFELVEVVETVASDPVITSTAEMEMNEPMEPEIPVSSVLVTDEVPAVVHADVGAQEAPTIEAPSVVLDEPVEEKLEPEMVQPIHIAVTDEVPAVKVEDLVEPVPAQEVMVEAELVEPAPAEPAPAEPAPAEPAPADASAAPSESSAPIQGLQTDPSPGELDVPAVAGAPMRRDTKAEREIPPESATVETPTPESDPQAVPQHPADEPEAHIAETMTAEAMTADPVARDIVDDLTMVEGIGPKYNEALHTAGITTYALLAASNQDRLTEILRNGGYTRIPASVATWAEQADYLLRGDLDGLKQLQSELVGGRRPGTGDD